MADARTFTLLDVELSVPQPFDAGHTCSEGEAKALNQLFKENLSNNFRKTVQEAMDKAKADGVAVDTEKLQADFDKLAGDYQFTVANVSASRKMDAVEREARSLVRASLKTALAAQGKKFSDLSDEDQEKLIDANASRPEVVEVAKRIVAERQASASLQLDLAAAPAPTTEPATPETVPAPDQQPVEASA